jgi:hypothetical protein
VLSERRSVYAVGKSREILDVGRRGVLTAGSEGEEGVPTS